MAKGDLNVQITDMRGMPVRGRIQMEFTRFSGEPGAGGQSMWTSVQMGAATEADISGIICRGGPGTMYRVLALAPHYRAYSFFQLIREKTVNPPSDDVEFWVKPGDVKNISAPGFEDLPAQLRSILDSAQMRPHKPEDDDLAGKSGDALYRKLGPLRKACLLNIAKKTSHPSADNCLPFIRSLLVCRQDRFFAMVDSSLPDRIRDSLVYKSAPSTLHEPLQGFRMTGSSFKTRDAHANLQITFMQNKDTGELAADIDIDEASGIEHGFEVMRNAIFRNRTNPYLIREFLLSADLRDRSLDPGYDFKF